MHAWSTYFFALASVTANSISPVFSLIGERERYCRPPCWARHNHLRLQPWAEGAWVPETFPDRGTDQGTVPTLTPSSRCKQDCVCNGGLKDSFGKTVLVDYQRKDVLIAIGEGTAWMWNPRLMEPGNLRVDRTVEGHLDSMHLWVFDSTSKQEHRTALLLPSWVFCAQAFSPLCHAPSLPSRSHQETAFSPNTPSRDAKNHPYHSLMGGFQKRTQLIISKESQEFR